MGLKARRVERRQVSRPRNGDVRLCPKCASHTCEFNERYRFDETGIAPAWLCDAAGCGFRLLVRVADRKLAGASTLCRARELHARAQRRMMKSRAKVERASTRIARSAERVKKAR